MNFFPRKKAQPGQQDNGQKKLLTGMNRWPAKKKMTFKKPNNKNHPKSFCFLFFLQRRE